MKSGVIEAIVLLFMEEVCLPILPLHRSINGPGHSLPDAHMTRVAGVHAAHTCIAVVLVTCYKLMEHHLKCLEYICLNLLQI